MVFMVIYTLNSQFSQQLIHLTTQTVHQNIWHVIKMCINQTAQRRQWRMVTVMIENKPANHTQILHWGAECALNALLIRLCVQWDTRPCWVLILSVQNTKVVTEHQNKTAEESHRSHFTSCCWKEQNLAMVRGMSYYRI